MAKKIKTTFKLQIPAGAATPAPPIGPALGQHGLAIKDFVDAFNQQTQEMRGDIIPVEITVYEDRSFTFILKTPPASNLLTKAAGISKGAGDPLKNKVGKINRKQLREIAEKKMPDLNAYTVEQAEKIIAGTARSMGIEITD